MTWVPLRAYDPRNAHVFPTRGARFRPPKDARKSISRGSRGANGGDFYPRESDTCARGKSGARTTPGATQRKINSRLCTNNISQFTSFLRDLKIWRQNGFGIQNPPPPTTPPQTPPNPWGHGEKKKQAIRGTRSLRKKIFFIPGWASPPGRRMVVLNGIFATCQFQKRGFHF